MDLRHLRYFVATVEEGSLQGAAQYLNVAQPALSRRIRDLEADLGCVLLERTSRGIVPTPAGTFYYGEALRLLEKLGKAGREAKRIADSDHRDIRFGLARGSRKYGFIGKAIAATRAADTDQGYRFTRDASPRLADALIEGHLDIALIFESSNLPRGLERRLVHGEEMVLALHPDHPLAVPGPVSLQDLGRTPLVWMRLRDSNEYHASLLHRFRMSGVELAISETAADFEELLDLTVVSGGACVTSASTAIAVKPGTLLFRPIPDLKVRLELYLAWRGDIVETPAASLWRGLQAAIDAHQSALEAGECGWAILDGHRVASAR